MLTALVVTLSCTVPLDLNARPPRQPPVPAEADCRRLVCLGGMGERIYGGELYGICDAWGDQLIRDCGRFTDECFPTYPTFARERVVDDIVYALDFNGDGRVDEADDSCSLSVLAYSWGGVTAVLNGGLVNDRRIAESRQVIDNMVLLDPFQPGRGDAYPVPTSARNFWSYRHSAPGEPYECSMDLPAGPYLGLAPICPEGVMCRDFDYSLRPELQVDHCSVPWNAAWAFEQNLVGIDVD